MSWQVKGWRWQWWRFVPVSQPSCANSCRPPVAPTHTGSCGTLHGAFVELVQTHSRPFGDAVAMCSSNPARIAGLQHVGTLEVGRRADIVMMDDELAIQSVIVSGTVAAAA